MIGGIPGRRRATNRQIRTFRWISSIKWRHRWWIYEVLKELCLKIDWLLQHSTVQYFFFLKHTFWWTYFFTRYFNAFIKKLRKLCNCHISLLSFIIILRKWNATIKLKLIIFFFKELTDNRMWDQYLFILDNSVQLKSMFPFYSFYHIWY